MNLNSIREGELKDAFDALEEAFAATGTDYYIIVLFNRYLTISSPNICSVASLVSSSLSAFN